MYQNTDLECLTLKALGLQANVGIGDGASLRWDNSTVQTGTFVIEKILIQGKLPQLQQFIIFYTLWMAKVEEAQKAIKSSMYLQL